jgi:hypothetical protein
MRLQVGMAADHRDAQPLGMKLSGEGLGRFVRRRA